MLTIRRILHPTDFSDLCQPAFEMASSLARDFGAELVVLHVSPSPVAAVVDGIVVSPPTEDGDQIRAQLEQIRPPGPPPRVVHRLERGGPADEILRVAAEVKPDLIVMGTHGRGGLSRLLAGSVAEAVMRKAPCPVVTVKEPVPAARPQGHVGS